MALSRKPKKTEQDPKAVEAFLQGNHTEVAVHESAPPKKKERKRPAIVKSQLRIPSDLLEKVDDLIASQTVKPSRNNWILAAIAEKVRREETATANNS